MLRMIRGACRIVLTTAPSFVAITAFAAVPPDAVGASSSAEIHDRPLCVLSVEPQMHLLSLAAPDATDGATISLFLEVAPSVKAGDLIRLSRNEGAGAKVELIEHAAKKCADLAKKAASHHGQHQGAGEDHSAH